MSELVMALRQRVAGSMSFVTVEQMARESADRIESLEAALLRAHDHMHELTAIIPGNDRAYGLTTELMSDIRAALKQD